MARATLSGRSARSLRALLFCLALTVVGFALSFVIRWQAAAPLLTLLALPLADAAHVHPFLIALISLVATQVCFLPYQSTVYLAFYHGSGELFRIARRAPSPGCGGRSCSFRWSPRGRCGD